MITHPTPTRPVPTSAAERITSLDAVRGVAVLGILVMNAVSFGLPAAAYFNLDAAGSDTVLDWVVGITGEVFVDQKMMALFSLLFGAGVVMFADRAAVKGRHPVWLSLWRNALLLVIGIGHAIIWQGDVLVVYALCSPLVLAARRLRPPLLMAAGVSLALIPAILAAPVQAAVADGAGLGDYWLVGEAVMSDRVGLWLVGGAFARALGLMLVGVALYRLGVIQGAGDAALYRRMAAWGLGLGLPLAAAGVLWQLASNFSADVAVVGSVPNTVATIPIALGYLGLIVLWNRRPVTGLHLRIRAAGRMALTNYLTQTVIGLAVLDVALGEAEVTRTAIGLFVVAVWTLQLGWSKPWLDRFRFGPFEWLWRVGTYRRRELLPRR